MPRHTKDNYLKISHAGRIDVIYRHIVHAQPIREIEKLTGMSYCSIRKLIENYKLSGNTNKKVLKISGTSFGRDKLMEEKTSTSSGKNCQRSSSDHVSITGEEFRAGKTTSIVCERAIQSNSDLPHPTS